MPDPTRFQTINHILQRTQFGNFYNHHKLFIRGRTLTVARFGPGQVQFPDPDNFRDLIGRAEGLLYTIANAVVSATPDSVVTTNTNTKQSNDWLYGITNCMETVLKFLKVGLSTLHVPYAYGFAIILLTVLVKAATFPMSKKQTRIILLNGGIIIFGLMIMPVESAMAMRSLQPQIKAIQERYAGDQELIQLETARLYKLAGINPLAGFFWIPSLAGPTTIAARQSGSGIYWLFPFVNNDPNTKTSQTITKFLPLMIGYFALSVPSGLSLYWLANSILSSAQQIWLQKMEGCK